MAEKIELFELDIDMDALLSKSADVQKNIAALSVEMKDLKKAFVEGSISTEDYYKEFSKLDAALKTNRKELNTSQKLVQAYTDNQSKQIQIIKQTDGSINQLSAALAKNRELYRNLSKEQRENEAIGGRLLQVINEQDQEYKNLSKSIGVTQVEVGNYKEQMSEALAEQQVAGFSLKNLQATFSSTVGVIGAVGAGLAALAKLYISSSAGAADLKNAQDQLSFATNKFGRELANLVGADGKGGGLLSQLAFEFNRFVFGISTAVEGSIAASLGRMQQEFEVASFETEKMAKDQLRRAEELRQIRDEERNSLEDRIAANEELKRVIDERERDQVAFQNKRLEVASVQLAMDKDNLELQKQVKEIEREIADIQEEASGFRSEALANDLALFRENVEQRALLSQAEIDERLLIVKKGSEEELKLLLEKNELTKRSELEAAGQNANLRATALQNAKNEELRIIQEFEAQRIAELDAAAQENIASMQEELRLFISMNQSKLQNTTQLNQELIDAEKLRLEEINRQQIEILNRQLENDLISYESFLASKQELQNKYQAQADAIDETYRQQQNELRLEREAISFEEKLMRMEIEGATEFEMQLAQLDREKQAAIAAAEAEGRATTTIEEFYAKKRMDIKNAELANKLQASAQIAEGLVGLLGEETEAGKFFASAKAIIDTYQAANLALATYPPPFGAIAAGVSIATGLKNVTAIRATKTKGPSTIKVNTGRGSKLPSRHTGGLLTELPNIPTQPGGDNLLITAKRGEVVLNESQQARLGGAMTFRSIGVPGFNTGGIVGGPNQIAASAGMSSEEFARAIGEEVAARVPKSILVEDIDTGLTTRARTQQVADV